MSALDQTTWAGSGSSFHCMKNLMPNWPVLTVKEIYLKTVCSGDHCTRWVSDELVACSGLEDIV